MKSSNTRNNSNCVSIVSSSNAEFFNFLYNISSSLGATQYNIYFIQKSRLQFLKYKTSRYQFNSPPLVFVKKIYENSFSVTKIFSTKKKQIMFFVATFIFHSSNDFAEILRYDKRCLRKSLGQKIDFCGEDNKHKKIDKRSIFFIKT